MHKEHCVPLSQASVRFVGVTGCSASGKSTVAHQLALALHSPLPPITLDAFFDGAKCEELGTYEDYRAIRYDEFYRTMEQVRCVLVEAYGRRRSSSSSNSSGDILYKSESDGSGGDGHTPSSSSSSPLPPVQRDDWVSYLCAEVPLLASYLQPSTALRRLEEDEEVIDKQRAEGIISGGDLHQAALAQDAASSFASCDVSLTAHEAEDCARLAHFYSDTCPLPHHVPRSGGDKGGGGLPPPPLHEATAVIHVVCEGFVLFCDDTHRCNELFDAYVEVTCDAETACVRRFQRAPRRQRREQAAAGRSSTPSGAVDGQLGFQTDGSANCEGDEDCTGNNKNVERSVYSSRIEKMWTTRTEERRRDLERTLQASLVCRLHSTQEVERLSCSQYASIFGVEAADAMARSVERMLSTDCFLPPRPSSISLHGEDSKCGDSTPANVFVRFWQDKLCTTSDGDAGASAVAARPTVVTGCSPQHHLRYYDHYHPSLPCWDPCFSSTNLAYATYKVLLLRWTGDTDSSIDQWPRSSSSPSSFLLTPLWGRYCEFRYWFMYEVFYYYCLFFPLQAQNMLLFGRDCYHRIENGEGMGPDLLSAQVQKLAECLLAR